MPERLARVVVDMYLGAGTTARTDEGCSVKYDVKVGLHQDLARSPLLFDVVSECVVREELWEMLYANNL